MITLQQLNHIDELTKFDFHTKYIFQSISYLKIFSKNFTDERNIVVFSFLRDDICIGYGVFEKSNNTLLFLGMKKVLNQQDVTDYGDIMVKDDDLITYQEIWNEILFWAKNHFIKTVQLDYVREDSPTYICFKDQSKEVEVAPSIIIPDTWESYIDNLERTDRKELKRKIKRLEIVENSFQKHEVITDERFQIFINLHKLSSKSKDAFMSQEMEKYFYDLIHLDNYEWKSCLSILTIERKPAAAVFTFENADQVLGYNSGFDPAFNYYSAGVLLHAFSIKNTIEERKDKYDFLRGKERYKFDLGAKPIRLFQILISL